MKFKIISSIVVLIILIVLYVVFSGEPASSETDGSVVEQVIAE